MRQNLQDKISCTHFVKYLCDETILPQPQLAGIWRVYCMAAGRILGQDSYLQHRKYQKPPGSLPVLIFSTSTQYRPIRHRLFTDTPRTDLSDTCSSQIHPVHSYQTPAIHRYTQYRPIRHLLFTDTPSTDLSDTCSLQIHLVHSYQAPALH